MNTQTIVKGIVCKKCGNELPEMTIQQHLDGGFVKECPHINENFHLAKEYLINIRNEMIKSDFKKYKLLNIENIDENDNSNIYVYSYKKTKTYDKLIRVLDDLNVHYELKYFKYKDKLWGEHNQCYTIRITPL